ncbi:superoxide dismutase family protein [Blastomonas sp.]|uniref:superoxide dismutase family protein n=1 Tax=Blastomonas sp. TaxID=1909299 RepID=UPI0026060243|nr:superoxide dismutase family protein [Blastomonas sp.]MDM7956423.1 superoxide dismutase family protein [Blastomonas sp.]
MIPVRLSLCASALACALTLSACGSDAPTAEPVEPIADSTAAVPAVPQMATASLKTADGRDVGMVTATEMEDGINISVSATGLEPGDRGIHVHATGKCDGPKFETAGGHWNPVGTKHGLSNPQGAHSGDMPNLTVASDGTGKMEYMIRDAGLAEMLDADGAALVIHAEADDQMTDPAGDSGDRMACGVFGRN